MNWHENYRVGQPVEALFFMAHGNEWRRCQVARKTRSGFPVVEAADFPGYSLVVDRKRDIRLVVEGQ